MMKNDENWLKSGFILMNVKHPVGVGKYTSDSLESYGKDAAKFSHAQLPQKGSESIILTPVTQQLLKNFCKHFRKVRFQLKC